ncbi:TPA: hypothetical protein ACP32N_003192 [Pseudomonas aeruginosa]
MLIDFRSIHAEHLVAKRTASGYRYTPANPDMPAKGKYLAAHQVFSNNGLNVALYIRHDVNSTGECTAAHAALRLTFTHKICGKYLLNDDPNKLSLNLGPGAVRELYGWLSGEQSRFYNEIVRAGAATKTLQGFSLEDGQFSKMISAKECGQDGADPLDINVGLSEDDQLHLQFYCLGLIKLLYPTFSDVAIQGLLSKRKASAPSSAHIIPVSHAKPSSESVLPHTPSPPRDRDDQDPSSLEKCRKAIFAVGVRRWRGSRDVIEFIQETASIEVMDTLIREGNAGDFSGWDRIAATYNRS